MYNTGTPIMDGLNDDLTQGFELPEFSRPPEGTHDHFNQHAVPFTILVSSESEATDAERHAEHPPHALADYALMMSKSMRSNHEDEWLDFDRRSDGEAMQSDLWTSEDQADAERRTQIAAYAAEVQTNIEEFLSEPVEGEPVALGMPLAMPARVEDVSRETVVALSPKQAREYADRITEGVVPPDSPILPKLPTLPETPKE
jgi:hypothetical protein